MYRPVIAGANPEREFSHYVTVERTLNGDANGTIGLMVTRPPGFEPCEHAGPGSLQPGKPYQFFADKDSYHEDYLVTAGSGALLLTNEDRDTELTRKYERR